MEKKDIENLLTIDYSNMSMQSIVSHALSCGMIMATKDIITMLEKTGDIAKGEMLKYHLLTIEKAHEKEFGHFVNFSDKH